MFILIKKSKCEHNSLSFLKLLTTKLIKESVLTIFQPLSKNRKNVKYFLILLLFIAIFIVSMIFGSSNNQIITFNYLIAKNDCQISTLLAIFFSIGFIFSSLICGVLYVKVLILLVNSRRKIKRLKIQLAQSTLSEHGSEVALVTNKKR